MLWCDIIAILILMYIIGVTTMETVETQTIVGSVT